MSNSNILRFIIAAIVLSALPSMAQSELERDYNVKPVPFSQVSVTDDFWTPRLEISRKITIPYCFEKCEETDRISNFEKAANLKQGKHEGIYFNDSDVFKVMEGAAYSLQINPEHKMKNYLDNLIKVMADAQWENGYLYTFYSVPQKQPEKCWTEVNSKHELYCAGHMYEGAVAHYEATGSKLFLDVAKKNADLVCEIFNSDKRTDPPGHQEIEIGLCRLYRATGDPKYLDQAKFFLDQRGRLGNRGPDGKGKLYGTYAQDHKPVTEQTKALGHSVRAAYLYTGMADVAALTGSMDYIEAIDIIWKDVLDTKLYITGGIGAAGGHEGFGGPYELPNMTAYSETCASIANVYWNHRMFLMHCDAKYIDVLERVLYNAVLAGVSIEGDRFFYPNPLESKGQHKRSPWFGCACCPSNIARFIPSIPGYTYAQKGDDIYVNLFISGKAEIQTSQQKVTLTQKTQYPWQGTIKINVDPKTSNAFAVNVRIPGWAQNEAVPSDLYTFQTNCEEQPTLKVNGKPARIDLQNGFAHIKRKWKEGDSIELNLPMPIRRLISNKLLKINRNKVALQRGPIVYCLEGIDNGGDVLNLVIHDDVKLATEFRDDLLGGVMTIKGTAAIARRNRFGLKDVTGTQRTFTAIPYYAWSHRGQGEMTVWPDRSSLASGITPK